MKENFEIAQANKNETHKGGIISEVIRTGDMLPGKELNDADMRMKLHALLEKAGRTSGSIRFSHDTGVLYVSFPDYGETLVLRGTTQGPILPDYTGKGKTLEFTNQAEIKVRNYLERKKVQGTIKTTLADMTSDFDTTA